jgi:uncharacterized membrane protein
MWRWKNLFPNLRIVLFLVIFLAISFADQFKCTRVTDMGVGAPAHRSKLSTGPSSF